MNVSRTHGKSIWKCVIHLCTFCGSKTIGPPRCCACCCRVSTSSFISLPPPFLSLVRHGSLSMSKSCRLVFCRFFVVVFVFLLWLLLLFCELRFDDCLVINPYNNYQPVAAAAAAVVCGCFADIDAEFNAPQAQQQLSSAHTLLGLFLMTWPANILATANEAIRRRRCPFEKVKKNIKENK